MQLSSTIVIAHSLYLSSTIYRTWYSVQRRSRPTRWMNESLRATQIERNLKIVEVCKEMLFSHVLDGLP